MLYVSWFLLLKLSNQGEIVDGCHDHLGIQNLFSKLGAKSQRLGHQVVNDAGISVAMADDGR